MRKIAPERHIPTEVHAETIHTVRNASELRRVFECLDETASPLYRKYATPFEVREYKIRRMLETASSGHCTIHANKTTHELTGAASWRALPWDTQQLGINIARIETLIASGPYDDRVHQYEALLSDVVSDCKFAGIRYLTTRVDAGDVPAIHSLERAGFCLIDSIQTFSLDLKSWKEPGSRNSALTVRPFQPGDLDDVLEIARTSYVFDRFHSDPAIGREAADTFHEAWLRNSCAGIACDRVIVGAGDSGVASYVTCKIDQPQLGATGLSVGTIVMVATANRARGQGCALATTFGALNWFTEQGVHIVEVGTQLRNLGAASLYQKAGFHPTAATFTFRKLL